MEFSEFEFVNITCEEIYTQLKNVSDMYLEWDKKDEIASNTCSAYLKDITKHGNSSKKETDKIVEKYKEIEEKINEEKEMIQMEKTNVEQMKSRLSVLKKEVQRLYKETEKTKQKGELSQHDKDKLSRARCRCAFIKDISGIHFDYTVSETDYVQGYVKSKNKTEIKLFKHEGSKPFDDISENIWEILTKLSFEEDAK